jgi:2-dehydro-3-deoxygluconokinase
VKRVVTVGETMALMSAERVGPLKHSPSLTLGIGGSESNVAIGLARLGVPVTWIGKVGSDALGDLVIAQIAAEGVELRAIRDPDAPTGLMIKERRTGTHTRVWYYRRGFAGSRLRSDELDIDVLQKAALLHVSGISLALSAELAEAVTEAILVARAGGALVSFDLNFRRKLWSEEAAAAAYRDIIPLADIVFAGEEEAAIALSSEPADGVGAGEGHRDGVGDANPARSAAALADGLVKLGAHEAVVKRGASGAVASVEGRTFEQAAVPIVPVDTVGAGDAFVAGYIAELLHGAPVPLRLRTAVAAGAYACLTDGDWEGLPTRDELDALFQIEPVTR